ncbi:hypothetical protein [Geotalea sp. SG265]|uniref:hypothetical protein n=1 Tax=Geotalea sp. SG265 TaxID=2922867 RepID=UPI001FAF408E|nr:hypothetical protein [Geotalea sp. SG265]
MTNKTLADFIFDFVLPATGISWMGFIYYSAYLSKKYKTLIPWAEANKKERLFFNLFISGSLGGIALIVMVAIYNK